MFPDSLQPSFGVAVSPDGRHIAAGVFGVGPQIWLHSLDTNETRPLAGTEGGSQPGWSPDGSTISYVGRGQLWKLNIHGGSPVALAPTIQSFSGSTWNQDGVILFISQAKLFRVPSTGGAPVEVRVGGLNGQPLRPVFLPDGRHFIVTSWNRVRGEVFVASLDSDRATKLLDTDSPAGFAPPDRLLFLRGAALMTQKFDLTRVALTGDAELVSSSLPPGALFGQQMTPSASATGVLAFPTPRGGSVGHLRWFDQTGKGGATVSSPPDAEYLNPAISPDGSVIAANRVDPQTGRWDIWLVDTTRDVPSKLTTDAGDDFDPVWSPDGKEIVFASERGGRLGLYRQSIAGGGSAHPLIDLNDSNALVPTDWSRDGRYILYQRSVVRAWTIWALPLFGDRNPILVVDEQFSPYAPHLSPDGQWLAYNSFESGPTMEVFVRRFLADGPKKQISSGGGVHPRWTRDGKELVYWSPPGGIHAHDMSLSSSDIRVGPRRTLLDRPVLSLIDGRTHYDITRDGQRLLVRHAAGPQGPGINVILNWTSKLKK
jgi:Tol biopolymer transport system component